MSEQQDWIARIIGDLRVFAEETLQPGLAAAARRSTLQLPTPLDSVLQLTAMFHEALGEALSGGAAGFPALSDPDQFRPVPPGRAPVRPQDYLVVDGRAVPKGWMRSDWELRFPPDLLGWLGGVLRSLDEAVERHGGRLERHIEDARLARAGDSPFAQADGVALDLMLSRLVRARRTLGCCGRLLRDRLGGSLPAAARSPASWPQDRAWQRLRRLATLLARPEQEMQRWLGLTLHVPVAMVDVPFLYQRWCTLQVLESAQRLGWRPDGDPVGAVFLGGLITLRGGDGVVDLWVEPRLSTRQRDLIGWTSTRELTPDLLFVTRHRSGRDAFVLDATLATRRDAVLLKRRYRQHLIGVDARVVAGVAMPRRVLRAWAVAPLRQEACRVDDPEGVFGTVPLNAYDRRFPALEAWLADVFVHAAGAG